MKHLAPRSRLPLKSPKFSQVHIELPPPIPMVHQCISCGANNALCVHKRKSGIYLCENCFRKRTVRPISKSRRWLWEQKAAVGCILCEEGDPRCLDYHHVHPQKKKFNISSVVSTIPTRAIEIEIRKCVVLCANCHRQIESVIHK